MLPDAIIEMRFFTPSEGGRTHPIEGQYYSCPMFLDDEAFDCRVMLNGMKLQLGETFKLGVIFLSPSLVVPRLRVGKRVVFWEGRTIGEGRVLEVRGGSIPFS